MYGVCSCVGALEQGACALPRVYIPAFTLTSLLSHRPQERGGGFLSQKRLFNHLQLYTTLTTYNKEEVTLRGYCTGVRLGDVIWPSTLAFGDRSDCPTPANPGEGKLEELITALMLEESKVRCICVSSVYQRESGESE